MQTLQSAPSEQPTPVSNITLSGVPTISMSDNGLEISGGTITNMDQFKRLMRRLNAGMVLLDEEDDEGDVFS